MSEYSAAYTAATGRPAPADYQQLDQLFARMRTGELLPPRSQQAVDAGLYAHALSDAKLDPDHYHYYRWVREHMLGGVPIREMSAQLIGMAFVSANVLATDLPQPLTINPWQAADLHDWPLVHRRAVIIENNGVFIWLHHLHPQWPLIDQGGNDLQPAYIQLLRDMLQHGLQITYLGDLDATGIRMADTLLNALPTAAEFLAIQTPQQVLGWLSTKGKPDAERTVPQSVQDPQLQQEMQSIANLHRFVEQEQLIADYERKISIWLVNCD